ncbi:MAG: hypothetical protein WBF17_24225, partial [Phycisphaerae bacterium]
MTSVQLNLTNLLLPAGPAAVKPSTRTRPQGDAGVEPARSPDRLGPSGREDRLRQASAAREDAPTTGRHETREPLVRPDSGDRDADLKSHSRDARGTSPKPARRQPSGPNLISATTKALADMGLAAQAQGQEGNISFESIVERLIGQIAQAAVPAGVNGQARPGEQDGAETVKAAGESLSPTLTRLEVIRVSLPDLPAGLKPPGLQEPASGKLQPAKAEDPAQQTLPTAAAETAKVALVATQAAELLTETQKANHPPASGARYAAGPSPQPITSASTGAQPEAQHQATSPALPPPSASTAGAKAVSTVPPVAPVAAEALT